MNQSADPNSIAPARNKPCPCGSGKKYKICCQPNDAKAGAEGHITRINRTSASLPVWAVPGQAGFITIEPVYAPNSELHAQGSTGPYTVVFTLARPGHFESAANAVSDESRYQGDSHLAITRPALDHDAPRYTFEIAISDHVFVAHGIPNSGGFLGKIVVPAILAPNEGEAEAVARQVISPQLSKIASTLDIPIFIWQVDIVDDVTARRTISVIAPYLPARQANIISFFTAEAAAIAAIYRDAITSNSLFYQFLCYYKILERIQERRGEISTAARASGGEAKHPPLKIPKTYDDVQSWLESVYPPGFPWNETLIRQSVRPECLGRSVKDVADKELRPLRDNIAHAIFDGGFVSFSLDHPINIRSVIDWLPSAKTLARFCISVDLPSQSATSFSGEPFTLPVNWE